MAASEKWVVDLARELRILYSKVIMEAPEYVPTVTDGVVMIERALALRDARPATELGEELIARAKNLIDEIDDIARAHDSYEYGLPRGNDEILAKVLAALALRDVSQGLAPDAKSFKVSEEAWQAEEEKVKRFFEDRGSFGGGMVSWDSVVMRATSLYGLYVAAWAMNSGASTPKEKG